LLLPLTHIAGVNVLIRSIELGREPIDLRKITHENLPSIDFTSIVPTQLHRAVSETGYLLRHLQSAHRVLVGGGPLSESLRRDADSVHVQVTETYGMTESSGGCVYDGIPFPGLEVKIEAGRIALKGDLLASYYLPTDDDPTIRPITDKDGWFLTSDNGDFDGRKVHVYGRNDDVVISGGEKISLKKVEEFLRSQINEGELAAFATPDPEWGELLAVATTVAVEGARLDEIERKMSSSLGRHAIPKRFYLLDQIPKTALGKIDRDQIQRITREGK
jgi:O-succinylbenzoic acid--CoA ligase